MNAVVKATPQASSSVLVRMAGQYGIDQDKMLHTLKATCFKGDVSNEQMMALLIVAEQHNLNPWTKEIYAFPDSRNGIVPVVGVDGWSRILNSAPQFDGMDFNEGELTGAEVPAWIECVIHRKDRSHPTKAKEYFVECKRDTQPWKSHPRRMLRHKAMIQCARLAFGFGGIYDEDEAARIVEANKDLGPRPDTSKVDMTLVDRYVGEITDVLNQDKDEYGIAADLREIDAELCKMEDLYTLVFDTLASRNIITKSKYRKCLQTQEPNRG